MRASLQNGGSGRFGSGGPKGSNPSATSVSYCFDQGMYCWYSFGIELL